MKSAHTRNLSAILGGVCLCLVLSSNRCSANPLLADEAVSLPIEYQQSLSNPVALKNGHRRQLRRSRGADFFNAAPVAGKKSAMGFSGSMQQDEPSGKENGSSKPNSKTKKISKKQGRNKKSGKSGKKKSMCKKSEKSSKKSNNTSKKGKGGGKKSLKDDETGSASSKSGKDDDECEEEGIVTSSPTVLNVTAPPVTNAPTVSPPSESPSSSFMPTANTTTAPEGAPSDAPTIRTSIPTSAPSRLPEGMSLPPSRVTDSPSYAPTGMDSVFPSSVPTSGPRVSILIESYYLAYVIPLLETEPTPVDLAILLGLTERFWDQYFRDFYAASDVQYRGIELVALETGFEEGFPAERFNYYVQFEPTVSYLEGSPIPEATETFLIMRDAPFEEYILDYVRSHVTFISCNEVQFRRERMRETLPPESPTNTTLPEARSTNSDSSSPYSGIAIAGAVFVFLSVLGVVFFRRQIRAKQRNMSSKNKIQRNPVGLEVSITDNAAEESETLIGNGDSSDSEVADHQISALESKNHEIREDGARADSNVFQCIDFDVSIESRGRLLPVDDVPPSAILLEI